uniref:InlB B-repeat-containing protein n=1 Tax=Candidatus Fimivicinus sp. TaxID=3056640 RepID=UPI003FF056D6
NAFGAVLQQKTEVGGIAATYPYTLLAAEWVNPEKVFDEPGTYTEQIRIYHKTNADIWVITEYKFTVEQSSSVAPAEITTMPVIGSPVKYVEGIKVSDLRMDGGKANVEGTFAFTELDKALFVGTNQVSVTFTPADPTQAEAVTFTIPVTVEKGDIVVTEAPTFTFVYQQNTPLKNRNMRDAIEGGVVAPSAVTWDFYDETGLKVKDPQADRALEVGNYQIVARARAASGSFNTGFFTVDVVIKADETKAFPMKVALEGNELHIKADTTYGGYGGKGTVTYTVNDTVVAENADPKAEVVYAIPESGDYTVKAEYTPAEHDNYIYKSATQTVKAVLPRTVTVNGGSGSGSYKPGQTVKVEFDQTSLRKYYEFKGWKITNAEGETVDVGVEDLTQTSISFTMPDEDVTVKATTSFSIQLFFKSIGDTILAFLMKVVEWIMGLFNGLGSLS